MRCAQGGTLYWSVERSEPLEAQAAFRAPLFGSLRRRTTGTPRSVELRSFGADDLHSSTCACSFCAHRFSTRSTMWRGKFNSSILLLLRPSRHGVQRWRALCGSAEVLVKHDHANSRSEPP